MKKISFTDILSALVFIPSSTVGLINFIRNFIKQIFRVIGKVATIFL